MYVPGRGDEALRRARVSLVGGSYFITLCTRNRMPGLIKPEIGRAIRTECDSIMTAGHWVHRAGIIMPDHVHLLVRLTGDLAVSRCVGRLKSKTRDRLSSSGLEWQPNFFEHRLRPDDSVESVVRYIFLNPHREGIARECESYPWFWLGEDETRWFTPMTDDGQPFAAWLQ
jgi:putative transposase